MLKCLLQMLVLPALVLCGGCFTLTTATTSTLRNSYYSRVSGAPREHVVVSNHGWYLFNCIPLVCGNAKRDAILPWRFFHDDVTTDVVQGRLTEYAAKEGAHLAELTLYVNDNVLFVVPGTSIPIPMPYVLCYHERLVSALLTDPPAEKPASAPIEEIQTTTRQLQPQPAPQESKPQATGDQKQEMKNLLDKIPDGGVK